MSKPVIFISHISEEGELAKIFKEYIENTFSGGVIVFASSDKDSLSLGDDWFDAVRQNILRCDIMIVLCSPISISRPWINFEAGAGWLSDKIRVIPLCHSGLVPGALPYPLKQLQAGNVKNVMDLKEVLKIIANKNDLKVPSTVGEEFLNFVSNFQYKVEAGLLKNGIRSVSNFLESDIVNLEISMIRCTFGSQAFQNHLTPKFSENVFPPEDLFNMYEEFIPIASETSVQAFFRFFYALIDNIKFILSHKSLTLSMELIDHFNSFLFNIKIGDNTKTFFFAVQYDILQLNFREKVYREIKMLKDQETYPEGSSWLGFYFRFSAHLKEIRDWIIKYKNITDKIIDET